MPFDFITYMEDVATRLKAIRHNPELKQEKFFKVSGIGAMEELFEKIGHAQFPALFVVDNPEGRLIDQNSSNLLDQQYYYFFVLQKVKTADSQSRKEANEACKIICRKIFSKMFRDKLAEQRDPGNRTTGLCNLNRGDISYKTVGPLGDNCHGIWASFTLLDSAGIHYDAEDWIDG